jgi:glycerate 2-kinase
MKSNIITKSIHEKYVNIILDSLEDLDMNNLFKKAFEKHNVFEKINEKENIYIISIGKVSINMYYALNNLIPDKITNSITISLENMYEMSNNYKSSHPNPSLDSYKCSVKLIEFLSSINLTENDIVIFAISGGTSAMLMAPTPFFSLEEVLNINDKLLNCGHDVSTINKVRKAISKLHGGGILTYLKNVEVYSFILCDNVQKDLSSVGSGLTFNYDVKEKDLYKVLNDIELSKEQISKVLQSHYYKIEKQSEFKKTNITNILLADTQQSLFSLSDRIKTNGYEVIILTDTLQGEAKEVAKVLGSIYRYLAEKFNKKFSIICSGEVTVTIQGNGKGGRCQELAWCVAKEIEDMKGESTFISFATDGNDYINNVAGAWVNNRTMGEIKKKNISWEDTLNNNNTYNGLNQLGQLITNINTNTNLCDLYVFFKDS